LSAHDTEPSHKRRRRPDILRRKVWSDERGLTVLLVILVLVIFIVFPLFESLEVARIGSDIAFTALLVSGATAVTKNRWAAWGVAAFAIANLGLQAVWRSTHSHALLPFVVIGLLIYFVTLAVLVFIQVFRGPTVSRHHIEGAIAGFLLLGLAWAFAYRLAQLADPTAISFPSSAAAGAHGVPVTADLVYFSFVTLTTVGYGDVTPVTPLARTLAMSEALTGQLFPAVLLARLVSLEIYHRTKGA
jgi:hypothetical protein